MKKSHLVALGLTAMLASSTAMAETIVTTEKKVTEMRSTTPMPAETWQVTKLLGSKVHSISGQSIGEIKDLALDPATGDVRFAILDLGGYLHGRDVVAVPWSLVQTSSTREYFTVNASREQLESSPTFDAKTMTQFGSSQWVEDTYRYYGVPETRTGGNGTMEHHYEEENIQLK